MVGWSKAKVSVLNFAQFYAHFWCFSVVFPSLFARVSRVPSPATPPRLAHPHCCSSSPSEPVAQIRPPALVGRLVRRPTPTRVLLFKLSPNQKGTRPNGGRKFVPVPRETLVGRLLTDSGQNASSWTLNIVATFGLIRNNNNNKTAINLVKDLHHFCFFSLNYFSRPS